VFNHALVAASLAACTTTGPRFTTAQKAEPGKAIIYVYRGEDSALTDFIGALGFERTIFYVNGEKLLSLEEGCYTWTQVSPGTYVLAIKGSLYGLPGITLDTTSVYAKADGVYYVRYSRETTAELNPMGGPTLRHYFDEVSESAAMNEIHNMTYSPIEKQ
jgi:hypothetical protein